tara:strand:+ start:6618 stop:6746 length:129 start_codon:yes stop_codon:yes gene_type:complete
MKTNVQIDDDAFEPIELGSVSEETKGIGSKSEELFVQESREA